jgi:hypothetical protein
MFFRTLICYLVSGTPSLKLFLNTLLNKGLLPDALKLTPVPYSTFSDAFERFSPHLFRKVFEHLIATLPLKHIPELAYAFTGGRGEWALTKPGEIGLTPTEGAAEGIH